MLRDKFGRSIRDLRISVTDRCNFRCTYCMPKEEYQNFDFLPKNQILTYEEISVVVRNLYLDVATGLEFVKVCDKVSIAVLPGKIRLTVSINIY